MNSASGIHTEHGYIPIQLNSYQTMKNAIMATFAIGIEVEGGPVMVSYCTEMPEQEGPRESSAASLVAHAVMDYLPENEKLAEKLLDILLINDDLIEIMDRILEDDVDDVEIDWRFELELDKFHEHLESLTDPMEKDILTELWLGFDIDALKLQAKARFNQARGIHDRR